MRKRFAQEEKTVGSFIFDFNGNVREKLITRHNEPIPAKAKTYASAQYYDPVNGWYDSMHEPLPSTNRQLEAANKNPWDKSLTRDQAISAFEAMIDEKFWYDEEIDTLVTELVEIDSKSPDYFMDYVFTYDKLVRRSETVISELRRFLDFH